MKHLKKIEKAGDRFGRIFVIACMFGFITFLCGFDIVSLVLMTIGFVTLSVAVTLWAVYAYLVNLLERYNSRNDR